MSNTKNNKVVKYKKRRYLNVGVVVFGATFIYLLIMIVLYFARDRITIYEVIKDTVNVDENQTYTGIILREEVVTLAEKGGYINFFACDGDHISLNSNIYTISEGGDLATSIEDVAKSGGTLAEATVNSIKDNIDQFSLNYSDVNFDSVYSFKFNMEYIVLESFNASQLSENNPSFNIIKALNTGILVYSTDNYENITEDEINLELFNDGSYNKNIFKSGDQVKKGDPLFKTITSEEWSVIIPLTDDEAESYKDKTSLKIKFVADDIIQTADFEIYDLADGSYGKLTFDKYCIRYANSRFLEIKIIKDKVIGLKIPQIAVVEKDLYVIPEEYCISKGGTKEFLIQTSVNGTISAKVVKPKIYYYNDGFYYVSKNDFQLNTTILKKDSSDSYVIGETKTLRGVYNVNNGYAEFQFVNILTKIDDYYIIEEKTGYSPSQYDYIILNGAKVTENEVVFRW